jgi:hypothetical protein
MKTIRYGKVLKDDHCKKNRQGHREFRGEFRERVPRVREFPRVPDESSGDIHDK